VLAGETSPSFRGFQHATHLPHFLLLLLLLHYCHFPVQTLLPVAFSI
jgi:cell shape-determining protein MreD